MPSADFFVRSNTAKVREVLEEVFNSQGLAVTWRGDLAGTAEQGSAAGQFLMRSFAPHYKIGFEILPQSDRIVVRLVKASTGLAGGVPGWAVVGEKFWDVCEAVAVVFKERDELLDIRKGE